MVKKITASTEIYGIIGNPVIHSKSPIIQNGWISDEGLNAIYCAFEPKIDEFDICFNGLIKAQIRGLNITAPFKEKAANLSLKTSKDVAIMGAANTIINENGEAFAHNTDGQGLVLDLDNRAKFWRENNENVTIIGAGGAAKGIIAALINSGVKNINIIARDILKANALIECANGLPNSNNINLNAFLWKEMKNASLNSGLIINATTIGLSNNGNLDFDFIDFPKTAIFYDMVYYPNETQFLKNAAENGNFNLNGIGMLVGQGALAFQKWFGKMPDFNAGLKRIFENA